MKTMLITERTDASIGLRLAGVESVCVRNADDTARQLTAARADSNIGVLLITEGIERFCPDIICEIRSAGRPLLVTVPNSDSSFENTGVISDYIRNAIGIKL